MATPQEATPEDKTETTWPPNTTTATHPKNNLTTPNHSSQSGEKPSPPIPQLPPRMQNLEQQDTITEYIVNYINKFNVSLQMVQAWYRTSPPITNQELD
jgi:hypothetical protein